MHPPADPWESQPDPSRPKPPPMYGRAAVPVPTAPLREPTAEFPPVAAAKRPKVTREVSWQRTSRPSLRSLSDGWGFTVTGAVFAFCGWGLWAAAGRGSLEAPTVGLVIMMVVAIGVFVLSRVLGYIVLAQILRRPRLHARWSHLLTGLFLTVAGWSYVANTTWVVEGMQWVRDQWQHL